jgi:predicted dinucleotide-binding enzyme
MPDIKTIAIIEATSGVGTGLARILSRSPRYRLLLMSDDHATLEALRAEIDVYKSEDYLCTMTCAREAAWEADIIVIAIQGSQHRIVADKVRDVAIGKVVISTSNPIVDAYYTLDKSAEMSAAEDLQKLLPHSKVVKAFNTMFPRDFISQVVNGKPVDVHIAGNHGDAIETVSEVVTHAGFNPVVIGNLAISREFERSRVNLILRKLKEYEWLGVARNYTLKQEHYSLKQERL